jgi:hypothetical protein
VNGRVFHGGKSSHRQGQRDLFFFLFEEVLYLAEVSLLILQGFAGLNLLLITALVETLHLLGLDDPTFPSLLLAGEITPAAILVGLLPLETDVVPLVYLLQNIAETQRVFRLSLL